MGASVASSRTTVKELNETNIEMSNETWNKVRNVCESKTSQKNIVNIVGSNVTKLTLNQKNAAKNTCVLQTALQTEKEAGSENKLLSQLRLGLEQSASAGIGVGATLSNTDIEKTNKYNFKADNRTVNETIMGCIMSLDQENVVNIVGSNVTESTIDQANDVLADCLSGVATLDKQTAKSGSETESGTVSEQKQTAKGLDPTAILASVGGIYSSIPISIICVCVISSIMSAMGGAGGGGEGGMGMPQGMPQGMPPGY